MNPKFEEYYAKWTSAPLSCVSVFHKYVGLAPVSAGYPLVQGAN